MTDSRILYGIEYSPWTQRARWALDVNQVAYRYVEYSPMLGEPGLRFRVRKLKNARATVPLLVVGDTAIGDSYDIMRYADDIGIGETLFPNAEYAAWWREQIELALEQVRIRISRKVAQDPQALKEAAALAVPSFLSGVAAPLASMGVRFFANKYGFDLQDEETEEAALRAVLLEARNALKSGRQHIEDSFSGVDIMVATLLQAVSPPAQKFVKLGDATRVAWHHEALAKEFADLVVWRDGLFEQYR